ncbi:DEAD/DEAH box helicase [Iamia sp. SCSIO 61187]|uniref:DEAD/DEAH box helicase n=1 Tax=Iamia sp. SCSIO 61187 TaxID=2722752 RepID=UPI001C636B9E|nr:DEAD/DEAH box helicase [Iamia sp. SCSIO 61187]QYG94663.1 DEAD/DEAH box helicase [Iamia sp. SCSIO 61187]
MTLLTDAAPDRLLEVLERRADGLVHVERIPARPARYADLTDPLPDRLAPHLPHPRLWVHQAEAIAHARAGRHVAVATGTASGKSLCFQLPIAEAVTAPVTGAGPASRKPGGAGTALLIGPTKALAQDQLRALGALGVPGLVAATYDGDASPEARTWARAHANVILTNPEMLHCGLLPHHERWATFLHRLRYVVVDELHTFRGVFGSHVAHVLRRLRRLCARYGADPTFVFASATIGQPSTLASALIGAPVAEVTDDGSPRGERLVALWNPPLVDAGTGSRVSAHKVTAALVADLVAADHRTIAFCRSRRGTEVVAADAQRRLGDAWAGAVRPYRGGYLAAERREIEAELFGGRLRGVVATSALELGVDVGGLDACVLDGFPGTIASLWQQAGRAGRAQQRSLAVLVAGDDALDQYLMTHPSEVFSRAPEPAVVNPSNPFVLDAHLACAAYETPLAPEDERWWGGDLDDAVRRLVVTDRLKIRSATRLSRLGGAGPRAVWAARGFPSHGVGLRSGGGREVRIVRADGSLVGTVDEGRAPEVVHPGAVYLHQGVAWRVQELDLDEGSAVVTRTDGSESTQARSTIHIAVLGTEQTRPVGRVELSLGAVEVTSQVTGYQRRDVASGEVLGVVDVDLPPSSLVTRAFWYAIPTGLLRRAGLPPASWPGTLHAAEHTAIGMLPLFTICDRWDVGGVSTPWCADLASPAIFVYDGYPGGAGIAELGYDAAHRHLAATLETLQRCPCATGCPSCVQSPKCGNLNEPLDKAGAIALLEAVRVPAAHDAPPTGVTPARHPRSA